MAVTPGPRIDLLGVLHFHSEEERGRSTPAFTDYRTKVLLDGRCHTTAGFRFLEDGPIWPGESVPVEVSLLLPELFPGSLRIGRIVDVLEGGRRVGGLEVVELADPALDAEVLLPNRRHGERIVDVRRWEARATRRGDGEVRWFLVMARDEAGEEFPFWPAPGIPEGFVGRVRLDVTSFEDIPEAWAWGLAPLPAVRSATPCS